MAGIEGLKSAGTLTGQLITISSGLLAFTVTFAEKFTPKDHPIVLPTTLKWSWAMFAVSILFGFVTLMALTGTLDEIDADEAPSNPERWNIRIPAMLMVFAFFSGIILLIVSGCAIASV